MERKQRHHIFWLHILVIWAVALMVAAIVGTWIEFSYRAAALVLCGELSGISAIMSLYRLNEAKLDLEQHHD